MMHFQNHQPALEMTGANALSRETMKTTWKMDMGVRRKA
jgi:hypothetical protein